MYRLSKKWLKNGALLNFERHPVDIWNSTIVFSKKIKLNLNTTYLLLIKLPLTCGWLLLVTLIGGSCGFSQGASGSWNIILLTFKMELVAIFIIILTIIFNIRICIVISHRVHCISIKDHNKCSEPLCRKSLGL